MKKTTQKKEIYKKSYKKKYKHFWRDTLLLFVFFLGAVAWILQLIPAIKSLMLGRPLYVSYTVYGELELEIVVMTFLVGLYVTISIYFLIYYLRRY